MKIKFQSLIGRLKTWKSRIPPVPNARFQSLIGRLKTKKKGTTSPPPAGFNPS